MRESETPRWETDSSKPDSRTLLPSDTVQLKDFHHPFQSLDRNNYKTNRSFRSSIVPTPLLFLFPQMFRRGNDCQNRSRKRINTIYRLCFLFCLSFPVFSVPSFIFHLICRSPFLHPRSSGIRFPTPFPQAQAPVFEISPECSLHAP